MLTLDQTKNILDQKLSGSLPKHIAFIMDGNRRWAKKNSVSLRVAYSQGIQTMCNVLDQCIEYDISNVTLFIFSTENQKRSRLEKMVLEQVFNNLYDQVFKSLCTQWRVSTIGDLSFFGQSIENRTKRLVNESKHNTKRNLVLAANYGGRADIVNATKKIAALVKDGKIKSEDLDESVFRSYLSTSILPDPDVIVRTGGDIRLSNFLLWESAYAEILIRPEYWPDFGRKVFLDCLTEFQQRKRRKGL